MMLTEAQWGLLVWIIEEADGEVLYGATLGEEQTLTGAKNGAERTFDPSDLRELMAQGLIRHVPQELYEVTNEGRAFYEQLKNPPQEGPPVGFQPD